MSKNDPLNSESTSLSFTQYLAKRIDTFKQVFLNVYKEVNRLLIKFEDIVLNKIELDGIAEYNDVKKLNSSILDRKISSPKPKKNLVRRKFNFYDRFMIPAIGGKLLSQLGYN